MIFIIKFKGGEWYLVPCKGSTQKIWFLGFWPKLPKMCVSGLKNEKYQKKSPKCAGGGTDLRLSPKNHFFFGGGGCFPNPP